MSTNPIVSVVLVARIDEPMAERARAGGLLAERHDDIGAIASTVLKSPDSPRGMSSRNGWDDARQDMA